MFLNIVASTLKSETKYSSVHSNFNPESKIDRGFINQLYIELGP